MRRICLLLALFAFLVQLVNGQHIFIRDAAGFAIVNDRHVFVDKKGNTLQSIASEYIKGAAYLPEHEVM